MGERDFNREYLGIPGGGEASPFGWDLFDRATQIHAPKAAPGSAWTPPVEAVRHTVAESIQRCATSREEYNDHLQSR